MDQINSNSPKSVAAFFALSPVFNISSLWATDYYFFALKMKTCKAQLVVTYMTSMNAVYANEGADPKIVND